MFFDMYIVTVLIIKIFELIFVEIYQVKNASFLPSRLFFSSQSPSKSKLQLKITMAIVSTSTKIIFGFVVGCTD